MVILNSTESFSVENLQALIICAFDMIGGGRGPSSWSIVGSMARTVEQLQLSIEEQDEGLADQKRYDAGMEDYAAKQDENNHPLRSARTKTEKRGRRALITRMAFIPKSTSWVEREERRRVFWTIFVMDRFCSIATGWNLSLTSTDVKRRLPCEGRLFAAGQDLNVQAPYFGIADEDSRANPTVPSVRPVDADDQALLGGFAFAIEATESLSLVTSFFLQHDIDPHDPRELQLWLLRFKQLDLRLVQWKLFLPERWREACVLNDNGDMDPNLTLAHMTHNTAVILLHQVIAFPLPDWESARIRLPSSSSTETCITAATEVATMAAAFMRNSELLTNAQFAFCLFICGRMFLAYSSYNAVPLATAFDSLVESLQETARRWNGHDVDPNEHQGDEETRNLASKFARRLLEGRQQAQGRGKGSGILNILKPACSDDQYLETNKQSNNNPNIDNSDMGVNGFMNLSTTFNEIAYPNMSSTRGQPTSDQGNEASPDSISMAFPPLPLAFQAQANPYTTPSASTQGTMVDPLLLIPPHLEGGTTGTGYDDLDGLLDDSFPPDQRVSVFSHANHS